MIERGMLSATCSKPEMEISVLAPKDVHAPSSCLGGLMKPAGKNRLSLSSSGTCPCYLSHPGTYPGSRARKTMSFFADDMRSVLGRSKSNLATCSIAIVRRSSHYPACVMASCPLAKYQYRKPPPCGVTVKLTAWWLLHMGLAGGTVVWSPGFISPRNPRARGA